MAATNKYLAQSNKSPERGTATKRRRHQQRAVSNRRGPLIMNESIDLLHCHFGLTLAQARLALHLAAGETLRSAAAKSSISYETARSHLKNIFNKTGTCRQAELVIVILTALPGCVGAPRRLGLNEQIFGVIKQIPGRAQRD
jgi:DNA-binding CsgD family transcriptional regulator